MRRVLEAQAAMCTSMPVVSGCGLIIEDLQAWSHGWPRGGSYAKGREMARFVMWLVVLTTALSAAGADDRHVVIITMDGFPEYVFRDPHAPIPTLRRLAAEGVAADGMRPV